MPSLITQLLAILPLNVRPWVELLISVVGVASVIIGVLPAKYGNNVAVKALRFLSVLTHPDQPGTFKIPFTPLSVSVSVDPPKPPTPPVALVTLLALVVLSCSGTQNVSMQGWQVSFQVVLGGAQGALPGIERLADSDQRLTQAQRDRIHAVLEDARTNALPRAEHDVQAYSELHDMPSQCRAHAAIDLAYGDLDSVLASLYAAGVPIPPEVAAIAGGLAGAADALLPGCPADAGTLPAMVRLMHALSHSSGELSH
jgi:hypothetical protein